MPSPVGLRAPDGVSGAEVEDPAMDYGRTQLADRLSAEYVSGLLRGAARRRFESLLPAHPALRAAVRAWEVRLMPLTAVIEPLQPSASVWKRIEAQIDRLSHASAVAPGMASGGWWRRLALWRGVSAAAGLTALVLALVLANPEPVRPPIVVVLAAAPSSTAATPSATAPSFVASITADGRAMVTQPLIQVSLQPDRSLELWALPTQGAPRSLGLISPDRATAVQRGRLLDQTTGFAVSLEPVGGSPSGAPSGPILYSGKLTL